MTSIYNISMIMRITFCCIVTLPSFLCCTVALPQTLSGALQWIGENRRPANALTSPNDVRRFAQEFVRQRGMLLQQRLSLWEIPDIVRQVAQRVRMHEEQPIEGPSQLKNFARRLNTIPFLCSDAWNYDGTNLVADDERRMVQLRKALYDGHIEQPDLWLTAEAVYGSQFPDLETDQEAFNLAVEWAQSMMSQRYTNKNKRVQLARGSSNVSDCLQSIRSLLLSDLSKLKGKARKKAVNNNNRRAERILKNYRGYIHNGLWVALQEYIRSTDQMGDEVLLQRIDAIGQGDSFAHELMGGLRDFLQNPPVLNTRDKSSIAVGFIPQILSDLLNNIDADFQGNFLKERDVRARIVLGFGLGERFWEEQWKQLEQNCWNASRLELKSVLKKVQRAVMSKADGQYQNLINLIQRFIAYLDQPAHEVDPEVLHVVAKNVIQSLNQGANAECGVYALHNGLLFARNARPDEFNDRSLYQPLNQMLVARARVEADRVMHGLHEAVCGGAVTDYLRNFEAIISAEEFPKPWSEAAQNFVEAVRAWIDFDFEAFVQGAANLIEQKNGLIRVAYGTEFAEDEEPYDATAYAQALQNLMTIPGQIQQQLEAATGNMLNPEIIEEIRRRSGAAGEAVVICPITPWEIVNSLPNVTKDFLVEGDLDERMYRKIAEFQNADRGARIELVVTNGGHWIVVDCIKLDEQRIVARVADSVGGYTHLANEALRMVTNTRFREMNFD